MDIAGALIGGTLGMLGAAQQQQYSKENMGIQYKYNEKAAQKEFERNKEMWNYTNFENQMKHIKAAGLSPGLIYGQAGAGGSSAAGGHQEGVSGQAGANPNLAQSTMMGLQMGLMDAQKKNIVADTKDKEAAAKLKDKEAGRVESEINVNNSIAELNKATKILRDKEVHLTEAEIEKTYNQSKEAFMNSVKTNVEAQLTEKQLNAFDDINQATLNKMFAETNLSKQLERESKAKIWKLQAEVELGIRALNIAQQNANANSQNAETNAVNARTNIENAKTRVNELANDIRKWTAQVQATERGQDLQFWGSIINTVVGGILDIFEANVTRTSEVASTITKAVSK